MKFNSILCIAGVVLHAAGFAQTTSGTFGTTAQTQDGSGTESYAVKISQQLEISGMVQTRFQSLQDTSRIDGFDVRRARLILKGDVAPKIGYRFQTEMAGGLKILDAVFTYKPFGIININIGQSKTPYCYDNYYSPFTQLSVSRTQIDNALSNRENDLYGNNNGRDIGIWLSGRYEIGLENAKRPLLEYIIGMYNGAGINVSDNNDFKDFGAALRVSPVKNMWISGRAYHGLGAKLLSNPDSTADRIRLGGDITYQFGNFLLEGEYLKSEDNGEGAGNELSRAGFTGTIGYTIIRNKLEVITRIDSYDNNADTDLNAVNKYIIAGSWYFSRTTRIQIEYDVVSEEDADNQIENNLFAIQFQAGF